MTALTTPPRAVALHRRAMDGIGEAGGPEPERVPDLRRAHALPGAGMLAIAIVGLTLGLAATAVVIARDWDPGAVVVGPWTARPRIGTLAIDPYTQAELARSGGVAMSAGEGLRFTATTDDTGYRLLRSCSYRLTGGMPPARLWTLTATDPAGIALDNAADRWSFSSRTVIRDTEGVVTTEVTPAARPGNWLPLSGAGPLVLTLRLYDTPLTGATAEIAGAALPRIARQACGGGG